MTRPDYIKCVKLGVGDDGPDDPTRTWCGRTWTSFDWTFENASHALLNARNGGRLLICKRCGIELKKVLKSGCAE